MELWKQKELEMVAACERLGLPVEVNYAPFQQNVPKAEMVGGRPQKLTDHETGNDRLGAGARSQRNFVAGHPGPPGNPEYASFTMSVDDKRLVLICRLNYRNYHAGDAAGVGNKTSGSLEICVNRDGDWEKTKDNAAKANAAYLHVWEMDTSQLIQHHVWYGKDCPQKIRHEGSWQAMIRATAQYLDQLRGQTGGEGGGGGGGGGSMVERLFPETGNKVSGKFLEYWNKNGGLPIFGLPITQERDEMIGGVRYRVQWFERARFEYHGPTEEVQLGLVGAEALDWSSGHRRPE
jgi:hypothetical protein